MTFALSSAPPPEPIPPVDLAPVQAAYGAFLLEYEKLIATLKARGYGIEAIEVEPVERATHRVLPGDTLWGIARSYNVAYTDIMQWNGLSSAVIQPEWLLFVEPPA